MTLHFLDLCQCAKKRYTGRMILGNRACLCGRFIVPAAQLRDAREAYATELDEAYSRGRKRVKGGLKPELRILMDGSD